MRKALLSLAVLATALGSLQYTTSAYAQASRTWVSGVGDDVNPCSRTAPCKTFAGAISKTAINGEINCLDPGGFGAVTIVKSITINCDTGAGGAGGILASGTNGINVNDSATGAPGTIIVVLRGLDIEGFGTGLSGINISSGGSVHIENVTINGFRGGGAGIRDTRGASGKLIVRNTVIRNGGGPGIVVAPNGGATIGVVLTDVQSTINTFGLAAGAGARITATRSVFSFNTTAGVEADPGAFLILDGNVMSNNGIGVQPSGGASVFLSNNLIASNNTGISGATTSHGNNRIDANVAPGTAPTVIGQQ